MGCLSPVQACCFKGLMLKARPTEKDSLYHMVPTEYIVPFEFEDMMSHQLFTHLPYPDDNHCSKKILPQQQCYYTSTQLTYQFTFMSPSRMERSISWYSFPDRGLKVVVAGRPNLLIIRHQQIFIKTTFILFVSKEFC